jgi:hypothetical protein
MTTTKPLEINESRDFMAADGKTVAVTRVTATCYRVVTLDLRGHSIPCYTAEFDHLAGNAPTRRVSCIAATGSARPHCAHWPACTSANWCTARAACASRWRACGSTATACACTPP